MTPDDVSTQPIPRWRMTVIAVWVAVMGSIYAANMVLAKAPAVTAAIKARLGR